jgi:YVTN family beta-propeller protein
MAVWIAMVSSFVFGDQPASVTIDDVARKIAPMVHLHSKDPHRPASVEWFIQRTSLYKGYGEISSFDRFAGKFGIPDGLSPVLGLNRPLTGTILMSVTKDNPGGTRTRDYSLYPNAAAQGQDPVYHVGSSPFSDYQLETLRGEPLTGDNKCTANAYMRITAKDDYYLVTYYFFYPYNGGMGPTTDWDCIPLGFHSGFGAHISDLERITAKLKLNTDQTTHATKISLINVFFEWHGNVDTITSDGNSYTDKPLDQLPQIQVYSCWHSHASHHKAGKYDTDVPIANDYADDGPTWNTKENLVCITDKGPDWVFYNGLWGLNIKVSYAWITELDWGTGGPGFHDGWNDGTNWVKPRSGTFAYITNLGNREIAEIDTATDTVVRKINIKYSSNSSGVAVNPAGTMVYVVDTAAKMVHVIDTKTDEVYSDIPVGSNPLGIAISPDGTRVYVANLNNKNISVIDTASKKVIKTIDTGSDSAPYGIALNSDGSRAYVSNFYKNSITIIDTATYEVKPKIAVGESPYAIAVSPDGNKIYTANVDEKKISVINIADSQVSIIDVSFPATGLAFNPDGTKLYASGGNKVSLINPSTKTVTKTIDVGKGPMGIMVNPAGTRLYVANLNDGTVSVINTSTDTLAATITVGNQPYAFGKFFATLP